MVPVVIITVIFSVMLKLFFMALVVEVLAVLLSKAWKEHSPARYTP